MWKLKQISIENLCAFRTAQYNISQGITTLIQGDNQDDDSQRSNGSGKSALIEAISLGITGDTLRKVKNDEIINDQADEAKVTLALFNSSDNTELHILRTFSRKNPQYVEVWQTNHSTYELEQVVKSSSAEYSKYILDTIGLSKDDVFTSFILSEYKYTSFLTSSDNDKKELINKFSNGVLVDEAMAALRNDLTPMELEWQQCEKEVSESLGKIQAVEEQIAQSKEDAISKSQTRQEKIAEYQQKIQLTEQEIQTITQSIKECQDEIADWESVGEEVSSLQNAGLSYLKSLDMLENIFSEMGENLNKKTYSQYLSISNKIDTQDATLKQLDDAVRIATIAYQEATQKEQSAVQEFNITMEKCGRELLGYAEEERANKASISEKEDKKKQLRANLNKLETQLSYVQSKLAGVIRCPKCSHDFILNQHDDVSDLEKAKGVLEDLISNANSSIVSLDNEIIAIRTRESERQRLVDECEKQKTTAQSTSRQANFALQQAKGKLQTAEAELDVFKRQSAMLQEELANCRDKMFNDTLMQIDEIIEKIETSVSTHQQSISSKRGSIQAYEISISELENTIGDDGLGRLEGSLQKYKDEYAQKSELLENVSQKTRELQFQMAQFVEFKTHLANSKIAAINSITNDFLEEMGSDIRIRMSGYTVLKSGKIRDKISIALLRNGMDCGSFGKFSKGERARVNLANILAMQKLTNMTCDDGKGLELLVLDEILDGTDELGLSCMFDTLNKLKITALAVTHGNVAENYPHKLIVHKKNGVSYID